MKWSSGTFGFIFLSTFCLLFLLLFFLDDPISSSENNEELLSTEDSAWLEWQGFESMDKIIDYKLGKIRKKDAIPQAWELFAKTNFDGKSKSKFVVKALFEILGKKIVTKAILNKVVLAKPFISFEELTEIFPKEELEEIQDNYLKDVILQDKKFPVLMAHYIGTDSVLSYFKENSFPSQKQQLYFIGKYLEPEKAKKEIAKKSDSLIFKYYSYLDSSLIPKKRVIEIANKVQIKTAYDLSYFLMHFNVPENLRSIIIHDRTFNSGFLAADLISLFHSQNNINEKMISEKDLLKILKKFNNEELLSGWRNYGEQFFSFYYKLDSPFPVIVIKSVKTKTDLQRSVEFFSMVDTYATERNWWLDKLKNTKSHLLLEQ